MRFLTTALLAGLSLLLVASCSSDDGGIPFAPGDTAGSDAVTARDTGRVDTASPADVAAGTDVAPTPDIEADVAPDADPIVPDTGDDSGGETDSTEPPRPCVLAEGVGVAGSGNYTSGGWTAGVSVEGAPGCARRFTLSTDAPLRPDTTPGTRVVDELAGWPSLQTGNELLDGLYAMTLEEVRECSVDAIRDGAFERGNPMDCPPGGCFETGAEWHYVWTRDTSYAVDLGLAELDPIRSKNSLDFKLSERRSGGDLQIVQDTGTGGSYPISTDRVVWALGVARVLPNLPDGEREDYTARAYEAIKNTVEHDRVVVWDPADGLYRGEQSFLDWREQTYPAWTAEDPIHIGLSKALSTNVLHLRALDAAAELAAAQGDTAAADKYSGWAAQLRTAIRTRLWIEDAGLFSTFVTTALDPAPVRRWDLLGSALAVLAGAATPEQAAEVVARYPNVPLGPPVIWPQQQQTPIYHNRAFWPFVTAYWLRAARQVRNAAVADHAFASLVRGAALNMSNMENLEMISGLAYEQDGPWSGPVINSRRQLWSVASFVSLVHDVLFGVDESADGVAFAPFVTWEMRRTWFAGVDSVALNDLPLRGDAVTVVVHLPTDGSGDEEGPLAVERVEWQGAALTGGALAWADVTDGGRVDVYLTDGAEPAGTLTLVTDTAEYRNLFAPRTPVILSIEEDAGALVIDLHGAAEEPGDVTFDVYRDGVLVADDLPGDTDVWRDEDVDVNAGRSHCYTMDITYIVSGETSQHAPPNCWWGPGYERVQSVTGDDFDCQCDCERNDNHGRTHCEPWGDEGDRLVMDMTTGFDGPHLLQLVFGNGAGPINTGITCGVKRLQVERVSDGALVAEGYVMMPHLADWGTWRDSSFVEVDLEAGVDYRVTIDGGDDHAVNMSSFAHFERYTGGEGGQSGVFNRQNIAELKILALEGR